MPSEKRIADRMIELAALLEYEYRDLSHLSRAMYCQVEEKYNDYANDAMATLGDAVLRLIFSEYLFDLGYDKDEITDHKKEWESNAALKSINDKLGVYRYAYNDDYFADEAPKNKRLPYDDHDIYIEASVAAIYKDRGLDYTRKWVLTFWEKHLPAFAKFRRAHK